MLRTSLHLTQAAMTAAKLLPAPETQLTAGLSLTATAGGGAGKAFIHPATRTAGRAGGGRLGEGQALSPADGDTTNRCQFSSASFHIWTFN